MTPMERARTALTLAMGRHGSMDKALEAAITVYLTALSEDEATVEKVAQSIDPNAFIKLSYRDPRQLKITERRQDTARLYSQRALTALASRDGEKMMTPGPSTETQRLADAVQTIGLAIRDADNPVLAGRLILEHARDLREAARSASVKTCPDCGGELGHDNPCEPSAPAPAETTAMNRQALDQSDNHQCAKCGRSQLYTYDQGWICPECSGRYMGKFPRSPETPGPQPVSEPASCEHPWYKIERRLGDEKWCQGCNQKVSGPAQPVSAETREQKIDALNSFARPEEPARAAGDEPRAFEGDASASSVRPALASSPVPTPPDAAQGKPHEPYLCKHGRPITEPCAECPPTVEKPSTTGESGFKVEVSEMVESHQKTYWVVLSRLGGKDSVFASPEEGRITPFKSKIREHAEHEAREWAAFLNTRSTPRAREGDADVIAAIESLKTAPVPLSNPTDFYLKEANAWYIGARRKAIEALAGRRVGTEGDAWAEAIEAAAQWHEQEARECEDSRGVTEWDRKMDARDTIMHRRAATAIRALTRLHSTATQADGGTK